MSIKVSVIVCTYNREPFLLKTLEALATQTVSDKLFEIVLIDNNSKDRTAEICSDFKEKYAELNFSYILESKQGLSFARNRGLDEAKGELLVFIDDLFDKFP